MRAKRLATWKLRAQFATGLSAMYAGEVPAYMTLVEVSGQVNSDYVAHHDGAQRLGSLQRITAERHGAIRVGSPAELAAVADLFSAFGMLPVGYYDLRSAASPIPAPASSSSSRSSTASTSARTTSSASKTTSVGSTDAGRPRHSLSRYRPCQPSDRQLSTVDDPSSRVSI